MSTTARTQCNTVRVCRALVIGLIAILILTSLALIAGSILRLLPSTTPDTFQADRIPVVHAPIVPVSVPRPPTANIQLVPSETRILAAVVAVVPVSAPTPPS